MLDLSTRRILVAADDALLASSLQMLLSDWGCAECDVVASAGDLVRSAGARWSDLIIVSSRLAGGVPAAAELVRTNGMRTLVLGADFDAHTGACAGVFRLEMPCGMPELRHAIARLIGAVSSATGDRPPGRATAGPC